MAASRLQLLSKKIIKPSSPTPLSLKSYKLSFMDQLTCDDYMPVISFYPNQGHENTSYSPNQISQQLQNSLSKLLKSYYPFAGTLADNASVNCNDMGATFLETRINCPMSEILRDKNSRAANFLFPTPPFVPVEKEKLLLAQLNHFDCGGKALSLCITHKLGDAYSLTRFMSDWATMVRQPTEAKPPHLIGESIFPGKDASITPVFEVIRDECLAKRFTFNAKTIAKLKALVSAESGVQNPSRVEVMTAFLYKCSVAASMANTQSFKPSALLQHVNLRRVTRPPLPDNSIGNMWYFYLISMANEGEMKLSRLVSKLRKGKEEFFEKCKQMNISELPSSGVELMEEQMKNELQGLDLHITTSMCGFPTNQLDFGWGKPIRFCVGAGVTNNGYMLNDDQNGDGVEAIVLLNEELMSAFEIDKEVLEFSSSN